MRKVRLTGFLTALSIVSATSVVTAPAADFAGWHGKAAAPNYQGQIFPPWQQGANNPTINKGFDFTVPEIDDLADFHGDPQDSLLSIFVGGNYYFAMAPLVAAFEREYPQLHGRIYYETLPPGILIKQMQHGDRITVGNMTWTVHPDVYAAGLKKINYYIQQGMLQGPAVPYVTNDLTIMIPAGNPAHIESLQDLGKPGVKLSMPNPLWEGVARQIKISLTKAGGPALEKMVYDTKVKEGKTILTHVHHRQTPLLLMQGLADAGVTWKSEAIFQEQAGHPISNIPIPAQDNTTAIYGAAIVKGAPHPVWAEDWIKFLKSSTALRIFEHYGFKAYSEK